MISKVINYFSRDKNRISDIELSISRSEVVNRSRILIVDDEKVDLVKDLEEAGYAVDYRSDITSTDQTILENHRYDLLILDFGNVGSSFGEDEGLSILRHVKRVDPSLVILAYTSKFLGPEHADFYRKTDGVLAKDDGIQESLRKVDSALEEARGIENLWNGLRTSLGIEAGSNTDLKLQDSFVRAKKGHSSWDDFKRNVFEELPGDLKRQVVADIVSKLSGLLVNS